MSYADSPDRSFAGMLSDRYSDSLERIVIFGDITLDNDEFYRQTKERDGYPVLELVSRQERWGCAEAVYRMCRAMGAKAVVSGNHDEYCVKRRIICDDKVLCRLDCERVNTPVDGFPPAALVLIADYAKGAVTEELMQRISEKYAGKEIIADWHPSRPASFYSCATALKASHSTYYTPEVNKPVIVTYPNGMRLNYHYNDQMAIGSSWFPAMNGEALDPCGAGDMVLATLGVGRLRGMSWYECCEWASENAAECCRHWGSVATGIKTYEDRFSSRVLRPAACGAHLPSGSGSPVG